MQKIKILVVDENNKPIGSEFQNTVTEKRLIRRIVRVLLFDSIGRIYLQFRSSTKNIYPNTWDQSAAGHVDEGETDQQSAIRELQEEIGIIRSDLTHLFDFYCEENFNDIHIKEWNAVFSTTFFDNEKIILEKEEVESGKWFAVDEVTKLLEKTPNIFSEGFRYTWKNFLSYSNKSI